MLEYILFSVLCLLCGIYISNKMQFSRKNKPPGPNGWPYFGVMFKVQIAKLHLTLYDWAKQYGDVFQFDMLGKKFICINSVDVLRDTFLKEPNATITANRSPTFIGKYSLSNYADVAFASPSPLWTKRRKLTYQLLHAYGEGLTCLEKQIMKNLQILKDEVQALAGRNTEPHVVVDNFIWNTLEILLSGRSFGETGPLQTLLRQLEKHTIISNPGYDSIYSKFPWLRFLPFPVSKAFATVSKIRLDLIDQLEMLSNDSCEERGIYHTMKEVMKETDKDGNQWLTKENVKCIIYDIYVAGYRTTRAAILSMIRILAKRPDLQRDLQKEVDTVIGSEREPRLSDRGDCPRIEAFILETLRYISHVPMFIFHSASQSTSIDGYDVEKDTVIVANSWTIHHSEKYWDEPFSFKPERFLDSNGQLFPATHPIRKRLLVFGLGKRSCIGEVFAKSRTFLFLSTLLQSTTIIEPEGKTLPDFDPRNMVPGIVIQPQPFEVRFVARSKRNS